MRVISFHAMLLLLLASSATVAVAEDRCTAMLVGAKASTTGAPMTTHTNDCADCDFRLAKVPAMQHKPGTMRDVVIAKMDYPRYVGNQRGEVFRKENVDKRFYAWDNSPAIGQIPEVNETFGYLDGAYGILNEHQLAFGESTCGARFYTKPATKGGTALFDVSELTRIAMQRCKTARCAVQLMGDLGVQYGYYGAEWDGDEDGLHAEAGEAITVTDTKEAWMFHILPDDTGKSAIWAAQRVPDDHICAIANQFVIHQMDLSDSDYFLASDNVFEVANRNGLWRSEELDGPFDFTLVYSWPTVPQHWHYLTRRVWRIFTLADPTLDLSPYSDGYGSNYPFSVKPQRKLSPQDILRFQRDHYEGTPFDMTQGPAAGPYGNPDRYDQSPHDDLTKEDINSGHFERAISIFRTSYSYVTVLNPGHDHKAYMWFGQYAPHATVYTPLYAQVDQTPVSFFNGSLLSYDPQVAFWAHAVVGNWASRFYKFAHPLVEQKQLQLEQEALDLQQQVLNHVQELLERDGDGDGDGDSGNVAIRAFLTRQSHEFATKEVEEFIRLFQLLVTKFHDGYEMSAFDTQEMHVRKLFYPKWWLQQVGFFTPANVAVDLTSSGLSSPHAVHHMVQKLHQAHSHMASTIGALSTTLLAAFGALLVGIFFGKRRANTRCYTPIH